MAELLRDSQSISNKELEKKEIFTYPLFLNNMNYKILKKIGILFIFSFIPQLLLPIFLLFPHNFLVITIWFLFSIVYIIYTLKKVTKIEPFILKYKHIIWICMSCVAILLMQYFFSILSEKKGSSFIWDSHYIYILSIPLAIIIGPVYEEFIFRYYISDRLFLNTRKYIAMIVSSLLFSVFHSPTNISSFVVYFIFGIIQDLLYKKTKNIYAPIFSHCMVNAVIVVCN